MSSETYSRQIDVKTVWLKQFLDSGKPTIDLFEIRDSQIDQSALKDGGVILQILCFSVDPYLSLQIKSNGRPKREGEQPMSGMVSGKVIVSKNHQWKKGDLFGARMQFSTFLLVEKEEVEKGLMWKLTDYINEKQISKGVGVLGMTGCTAYVGVVDILKPKQGDTLFISAASGAVGHLVSQISKIFGVKTVIGSCGTEEKCEKLKANFGFDYAVNYKTLGDDKAALVKELKKASPDGIDLYFDNVGGIHFDAAVEVMKLHGRVAICGLIGSYHEKEKVMNKVPLMDILDKQLTIQGFMCFDWLSGTKGETYFLEEMSKWMKEGRIEDCETIVKGIDSWSEAFCSLFSCGSNHIGKLVVMV